MTHPPGTPAPDHDTLQALTEAADWYALLQSSHADDLDRAGWQDWLAASPAHQEAWQHVERIHARLHALDAPAERQAASRALRTARQPAVPRRQLLLALLAGGGALMAWQATRLHLLPDSLQAFAAEYRTGRGETRHLRLADGSDVWLNTGSAMDADYSPAGREIRLYQGDILVQTAHEAHERRDFVVTTRHARLRALGTRYAVAHDADDTLLSVFAGAVEVMSAGGRQTVHAGEQLRITARGTGRKEAADAFRDSWRRGILLADGMRLDTLLRELNRHYPGRLGSSAAAGALEVLGTYPLNNAEQALEMLGQVLPVRTVRTANGIRVLLRDEP